MHGQHMSVTDYIDGRSQISGSAERRICMPYCIIRWGMTSKERHEARYQRRKAAREEKKRKYMKEYDDFDKVFSFNNLYRAFFACKKGVRWKYAVKNYNIHHLKYTWMAYKEMHGLYGCRYRFMGHTKFRIVERGKERDIAAVKLPDRVKDKCFADNSLTPATGRRLIYDNPASRKGMGVRHTRQRIEKELRRMYRKYGREFYIGITDCKNYFGSLRHEEIIKILNDVYKDERLIRYAEYRLSVEGKDGVGIGLGCQNNQNYAITYMDSVDHVMTGMVKYKRYMDDEIMFEHGKDKIQAAVGIMVEMCREKGIALHEEKIQIIPATHSFSFMKTTYRLTENGKIIRKPWKMREKKHRRKLRLFRRLVDNGEMDIKDVENFQRSFCGSMKEFDALCIIEKMQKYYENLFPEITGAGKKGGKEDV